MAINTGKVVVGGLASGVVVAVLDFVVNGLILADQNRAAMEALNPALTANLERPATIVGFIMIDLLLGLLVVWTYAAIRSRFGAGPKTAALAGVQVWLVAMLAYLGMTLMGLWSWGYFLTGGVVYLVVMIVAALVGARLYSEA